ncbi:MAG TPA: DUF454 domain-containing protein [Acidobacteria bacterium]|nr:DUF454 domain-containing protein [Acidobacteriota bacterium]
MAAFRSRFVRALFIFAGTLSVALGVLGIFLPLVPTTPFLLLAAYCYTRSSPRLLEGLLTSRWFGAYIRNYREGRGIPMREKVLTLSLLWLTIAASTLFVLDSWPLRLLLLAIAAGVTIHVVRVKTFRPEREA